MVAGLAHNKLMSAIIDLAPLSGTLRLPQRLQDDRSRSPRGHRDEEDAIKILEALKSRWIAWNWRRSISRQSSKSPQISITVS